MDPSQLDVTKLSENDKKELNQFLTSEAQKTTIQQSKLLSNTPSILFSGNSSPYHVAKNMDMFRSILHLLHLQNPP